VNVREGAFNGWEMESWMTSPHPSCGHSPSSRVACPVHRELPMLRPCQAQVIDVNQNPTGLFSPWKYPTFSSKKVAWPILSVLSYIEICRGSRLW